MLISQRPQLTEEFIDSSRSKFVIEPLEPGFGYTLGNSLRRTLLSSIPGAAVTSIKIDGVLHEFTTINGVKEDVSEIILNIKSMVLSSDSDEPVVMYLSKEGPGDVTAGDIQPPAGVEIHNPDLHIASLNDTAKLDIELVVERGRGYVPAVQNKASGAEIGRIPVDSIYSPVLKVTYKVEATRVEQRTDFDKLILDVETKNSISPRDALASAGKTLVELFGLARELNVEAEGIEIGPSPAEADHIASFALPIDDLDLTVRSYNCLKREGVHTVGELPEVEERLRPGDARSAQLLHHLGVVGLVEEGADALGHDRADIVDRQQLIQAGVHDAGLLVVVLVAQLAEMAGQVVGGGLAHVADAQAEQEAWQGRLFALFQRIDDVLRALVGHALQLGQLGHAQLVQIRQGAHDVAFDQLVDQLLAQAFDVGGGGFAGVDHEVGVQLAELGAASGDGVQLAAPARLVDQLP